MKVCHRSIIRINRKPFIYKIVARAGIWEGPHQITTVNAGQDEMNCLFLSLEEGTAGQKRVITYQYWVGSSSNIFHGLIKISRKLLT